MFLSKTMVQKQNLITFWVKYIIILINTYQDHLIEYLNLWFKGFYFQQNY